MKPEDTLSSELIYEGRVISVRRDTVRTGTGATATREIVHHAPVVVMAPMTADGDLLLVRQYRKAVERELLELPAGGVEPGESIENAVRREMIEETGYDPGSITPMTTIYPTPGISDESMHLFRVADLKGDGQATEPADEILCRRVTLTDAVRMVMSGEIVDAKTIIGVLMLESGRST